MVGQQSPMTMVIRWVHPSPHSLPSGHIYTHWSPASFIYIPACHCRHLLLLPLDEITFENTSSAPILWVETSDLRVRDNVEKRKMFWAKRPCCAISVSLNESLLLPTWPRVETARRPGLCEGPTTWLNLKRQQLGFESSRNILPLGLLADSLSNLQFKCLFVLYENLLLFGKWGRAKLHPAGFTLTVSKKKLLIWFHN